MLHYLRDTADKVEYGYTEVAKRGRIEGIEFLFALVRPRLNEGLPKDYDSNRLFFFLSFFFEQITEQRSCETNSISFSPKSSALNLAGGANNRYRVGRSV